MSVLTRVLVLLVVVFLGAAGGAYAQATTLPQEGSGVSTTPPVPLDGEPRTPPAPNPPPVPNAPPAPNVAPRPPAPQADALPNTGSDPRLLLLVGATLTLFGVGLRLRTADADLY